MIERNSQYIFKAKEILKRFKDHGSEAFLVGETVRNLFLDVELSEIEIFTVLKKDNAKKILSDFDLVKEEDFSLIYLIEDYRIRISFIRFLSLDSKVLNEKYNIKNHDGAFTTIEFLATKAFTINTLLMSLKNVVYDYYGGEHDLKKKRITLVHKNKKEYISNNPLAILEALKMVSELGFKLERKTKNAIKSKVRLLKKVRLDHIAPLMKDIMTGPYFKKAYKYIDNFGLYKYLQVYNYGFKRLSDQHDDINKFDYDYFLALIMVKKKKYIMELGGNALDEENVYKLVNLAIANPKCNYDNLTLYSNTLNNLIKANRINHTLKRSKNRTKQITQRYNDLPIKKTCDLKFKGEDIIKLIQDKCGKNYSGGKELTDLVDEIIFNVINGDLSNDYGMIRRFVMNNLESITGFKIVNPDPPLRKTNEGVTDDYEEYSSNVKNKELIDKTYGSVSEEDQEKYLMEKLKEEFDSEVESCIERSGMLEGLTGVLRESSYETLKKVYQDIVISKKKYEKLKEFLKNANS